MKKTIKEIAEKIATDKVDVNISVPSMRKANNICWELRRLLSANYSGITTYRVNKKILLYSVHDNNLFTFRYDKDSKHMAITFKKDGKEEEKN